MHMHNLHLVAFSNYQRRWQDATLAIHAFKV